MDARPGPAPQGRSEPPPAAQRRGLALLRAAVTLSQFGTQLSVLALPLLAVLVLDASALAVALLPALQTAAFLLVGLPAGVWVDRLRRRPVLVAADLLRAAVMVSIPVAAMLDVLTLAHMYAVVVVTGFATVFFDVSYQSYLPSLVDRAGLPAANARMETSRMAAHISAPVIGGWLVEITSAASALLVDAVTYLVSAVLVGRIRAGEAAVPAGARRGMWTEVRAGARFVFRHSLLGPIAVSGGIVNLFASMIMATQVVFLARDLDLSPGRIGLLMAAGPVGGIAGAIGAAWLFRRVGSARVIWLTGFVAWPFAALMPLAEQGWRLSLFAIGWGVVSAGILPYNVAQVSLRQAVTPPALLGRMNATMRFALWGALALGAVLGGVLAETLGTRAVLCVAAVGAVVGFLPLLYSPLRGLRDIPTNGAPPDGRRPRPVRGTGLSCREVAR